MSPFASHFTLLAVNLLIALACVIFASGFFPYKPFLPGLATYDFLEGQQPPQAPFDKIIFMVVDALRRLVALRVAEARADDFQ